MPEPAPTLKPVSDPSKDLTQRLGSSQAVYESIAALPFKFKPGERTSFDHTSQTVIIGVKQLEQLGITKQGIVDFIVLHELGHFKELNDDPEGYKKVIEEGSRADGLGKAYFGFYNALMDIYVNTNTKNRAPLYGGGGGGGGEEFSLDVKECYREQLFKERDFTDQPHSTQYAHYLLNLGMGVASDITVSPEVRGAINQGAVLYGQKLSTQDIIDTYLRPALGFHSSKSWQATIGQRKIVIDQTLRPIFEKLVKLDQEQKRDPNQSHPGDMEGFEASPDDLKRAVDEVLRRKVEANKSAQEKAQDNRAKDAKDLASKYLNPEEANDLAETLRRVEPTARELVQLFKSIIKSGFEYKREEQGHFKQGTKLDMQKAISQWGKIATVPDQARVMTRDVYEEVLKSNPTEVRVWLVPDLSGSMDGDIELVRDLAVSFATALQTLSAGAKLGQHTLRGSLSITGFNDNAIEVLPLTKDPTLEDIAKGYKKLKAGGGTSEHLALLKVLEEIKREPPNESRVDIVIGITDGDTDEPTESHQAVLELERLGVKLCAFKFRRGYIAPDVRPDPAQERLMREAQTPIPEAPPTDTFSEIWRTPKGAVGHFVRGAAQVIPAMREALRGMLTGER